MIIIRLSGGLGNQMFQYALGRALSLRAKPELKTDLKLDTSAYILNLELNRSFKLSHFSIPEIDKLIATDKDFKETGIPNPGKQNIFSKIYRKLFRIFESLKSPGARKFIFENSFGFMPSIMDINHDCYLAGVWQSEKYFTSIKDIIHSDFQLKEPLSAQAEKIKALMSDSHSPSVAIHIRRGDQVNNPHLLKKHGDLAQSYYSQALAYIKERSGGTIRAFVFSDDIQWVKENMSLGPDAVYVSEYNLPDYEELTLMSYCNHNIIAKSSYSWWGAWLNQNPHKIVVAPKYRFGSTENTGNDDLIPPEWVQL